MSSRLFYITLLTMLSLRALGQLSPGELSKAHAELEGLANCTQCHEIGKKVSNDKCLSCHQEVRKRIDQGKGYHFSREVRGKDCASCHSDHHGRNFDMVRLDINGFNHNLTGYELQGTHKRIDCRECHQPDLIVDLNAKNIATTFLGLDRQCLSCHTDYHQKTLSNDCARCHNAEAFAPAVNFDHNKTDFALTGKHLSVDCAGCHQKETRNGSDFQRFSGVAFDNCSSCHNDAHNDNLGSHCNECHTDQSFTILTGNFNHSRTPFPLKGKHAKVNCAECHSLDATPLTVFQDRKGIKTQQCSTCHEDVHEKKFGNQCADCHNEQSFRVSGPLENFNHKLTGFELAGKHVAVDCRKCHEQSYLDPLPHNDCANCHADYHQGQFAANRVAAPDCAGCHTVEGFEISLFTLEDHNRSDFPLEGAHAATPCFACHQEEGQWNFRGIGERCVDCHQDVHAGEIDSKFYPQQACEQCHVSISWKDSRFNHDLTRFKLAGAHARQKCGACHVADSEPKQRTFAGLPTTCSGCHEDAHYQQFEKNGATDCARCHGFENWGTDNFNHNKTAFKLEGKHIGVPCAACHKEIEADGKVFVQYKFESFECVVCHR